MRIIKVCLLLFTILLSGGNLLSQVKEVQQVFKPNPNSFRYGLHYCMNGTGDERTLMYNAGYSRILNRYLEAEFGVGFSNYVETYPTGVNFPKETHEMTSIIATELNVKLLVLNTRKHFIKFGLGYSVRKVKAIHFKLAYYIYPKDDYYGSYASIKQDAINGFDSGIVAGIEYGFRFTPNWAMSASGKYYEEGKYVSLVTAGINLYYSF